MSSNETPPPKPDRWPNDPAACERCGGAMQLLNVLPRLGQRPGYRIFGCNACSAIQWIDVPGGRVSYGDC